MCLLVAYALHCCIFLHCIVECGVTNCMYIFGIYLRTVSVKWKFTECMDSFLNLLILIQYSLFSSNINSLPDLLDVKNSTPESVCWRII